MSLDIVLEEDLRWREAELASLKRLAIGATEGTPSHRALLRALWALLYAHFEGFTKLCWDTALDQIQAAEIPTESLDEKFKLLALEPEFKTHRANLDPESIWSFFNSSLPTALIEPARFPEESRLKTESNLWPNIFERECGRIGIQCSELENSRARIKSLVARRNEIAHGKQLTIDTLSEYQTYEHATLCLMHDLAIRSIEIIEKRSFMKEFAAGEHAG